MLSARQFSELLNLRAPLSKIISVYLPVDHQGTHARTLASLLRAHAREESAADDAGEDLKLVEEFAAGFAPSAWRGAAIFSCKALGVWRACPLPEPVRPALRIGERPYLAPLLSVCDQYQRFGVVLAGRSRVRFLEVFMGQIREYEELAMSWPGLGPTQSRAVAEKLDGLARNQEFSRIVVGAEPEISDRLAGLLRTVLQQNLILDETLGAETASETVLERIRGCEDSARKVRESVLAHRLLDLSRSGEAVLGLDRTLRALRRGQVRLLLIRDGFAKMGYLCQRCGDLSVGFNRCPACNGVMGAIFNVVDELIQRALDGHCEVVRLLNDSVLDSMGHIGAELSAQEASGAVALKSDAAADSRS
ncbi:MAG: hypothetical protein PHF00_13170 [Elusimicrobia bacterium]|nr:hypothetical protein [Elusimicrobiota bacterium]